MTFEQSLTKLEETVKALEKGDIALDEAMGLFEKGVTLSRECEDLLDKAEQKVKILLKDKEGQLKEEDME